MKSFIVAVALLLPLPALSQSVDLKVLRGDCAGAPPVQAELTTLRSSWIGPDTLEVTAWDSEDSEHSVMDNSASLDTSVPGTLRLFYRINIKRLPPDAPVVMCEDFVKLKFVVRGVRRADYKVSVEKAQLVLQSDIEG